MATNSPKVVLFFGKDDIYSQFHPAKFTIKDVEYSCCEQYMMHQKAVVFGDTEYAELILEETLPKKMKALGRKVRGFDDTVWDEKCRDIVYEANLAKFQQNPDLRKQLLSTKDSLIGEASPFDRRWGIGFGKRDKRALDPKQWKGRNWLGEAIMKVRQTLQEEDSTSKD